MSGVKQVATLRATKGGRSACCLGMKLSEMGQGEELPSRTPCGVKEVTVYSRIEDAGKTSFGVLKSSMRCFKAFTGIHETYGMFRGRTKAGKRRAQDIPSAGK